MLSREGCGSERDTSRQKEQCVRVRWRVTVLRAGASSGMLTITDPTQP